MEELKTAGRRLLRLTEVAASLGLGKSTVYLMVQRGELPVIRIGTAVRVPADALDEWVERKRAEAEAELEEAKGNIPW